MTALMLRDRVVLARMSDSMPNKGALTVVQYLYPAEFPLQTPNLSSFFRDIFVQAFERPHYDVQMVQDEVGQVAFIRLRIEICPAILGWGLQYDLRDRDVFRQPIPMMQHRPIEERARRSAIPINEWVVVPEHEVKNNRPDNGVDEGLCLVGEIANLLHPRYQS